MLLIGWFYEIKVYRKNLLNKTKCHIIHEIEEVYLDLKQTKKHARARKNQNIASNKKRKKRK